MKQQIQLAISVSPDSSLQPIMPNHHDRFSPRQLDESIEPYGYSLQDIQTPTRGRKNDSDCLNLPLPQHKLIHPEGGPVHSYKHLVSDCPISYSLRGIGDQIIDRCSVMGRRDITVFIRHMGTIIEYYVADHSKETLIWINDQLPDCLQGLTEPRVGNTLCEEYWAHMETFPGVRPVSAKSVRKLKDVLSSLAIDSSTSDGSTSPFSYEQIQNFLRLLSSFSESYIDEYQTYAVARLWNMVWHARVINNFGSRNACLDRFITLSSNPPLFTRFNAILAFCTLGVANKHLARCSRAWAGRIAYVTEWRQFKSKNEAEWKQVTELACALVIACLLLSSGCTSKMTKIIPTLTSLLAVVYSHYLMTESQNLGDHAADASVYFQKWEQPEYNVQRIALRNSVPQAALMWAFIAFVCSIPRLILS